MLRQPKAGRMEHRRAVGEWDGVSGVAKPITEGSSACLTGFAFLLNPSYALGAETGFNSNTRPYLAAVVTSRSSPAYLPSRTSSTVVLFIACLGILHRIACNIRCRPRESGDPV